MSSPSTRINTQAIMTKLGSLERTPAWLARHIGLTRAGAWLAINLGRTSPETADKIEALLSIKIRERSNA